MASQTSTGNKFFWAVVADESTAIVYARDSRRGPLRELFSLKNEIAREKTDQLISDKGGRSFDSKGKGRHTMTNEKGDPKKHAATAFARQVADHIGKAVHDGTCLGFAIVAAPRFLGELRSAISKTTSEQPYATADKEMVGQDPATIQDLLNNL